MLSDTWAGDRPRSRLKEFIKRCLFVQPYFDAAFVPGALAHHYAQSLGIPPSAIWTGSYVVDNDYFSRKSLEVREHSTSWQSRLDLPQNFFLTAARLSPEKNLLRLLQAFGRYREMGGQWSLVIAGSGPQERQLRQAAGSAGWGATVHFAGWTQYEHLPAYYALARCFILPSLSEPWGLVVNEAMACGAPVLVSRKCGCLPELCRRDMNGFDFDPYDPEALAHLLRRVSQDRVDLAAMGQASQRIIAGFTLDTFAQGFKDCIETTVARLEREVGLQARRNLSHR
jgi:glycosyltransferase involved in cell wall biosynthesis